MRWRSAMPELHIEVIYALADRQRVAPLRVPPGTTARSAVEMSGFQPPSGNFALGLFGRRIPPGRVLKEGDRVEILRPLAADPKEARRRRARKA